MNGIGQVREKPPRFLEGLVLARRLVVHRAIARVDVAPAEFVLLELAMRPLHHRRTRDEHLRGVLDHHRVVARHHARRAQARDRSERERHHRDLGKIVGPPVPEKGLGHRRMALQLEVLHRAPAARAVHEAHQRQPQVAGEAFDGEQLVLDAAVVGAAAHREIVAGHRHRPPVDTSAPVNEVGRREVDELARARIFSFTVFRPARQAADFVERARIEQPVDALAHRQLAAVVLALDLVRPAHLLRERLAPAQLLDFLFPAHAQSLSAIRPASTAAAPQIRSLRCPSLSSQAPISAPKITDVSRSAATTATGARVIAQSAMP